jgi:uncharacterized RDD family membrane protein YckC
VVKMKLKKPETFWTALVLFVVGIVIALNIIRFNFPDFTPEAIFALLIGVGFIIAGYGLWVMKKWGAILGIILCCLKLVQIQIDFYSIASFFDTSTLIAFIVYTGIILLVSFQGWKKLKY